MVYALIVTLITLTVAYPVAYWISFYGGTRKNVYLLLLLLPFFVSFVLRTVQFQYLFSDNGPIVGTLKHLHLVGPSFHILSTPVAVILGISYNYLPFTALPIYVSLERIEPRLLEAGRDLYAGRWNTFWKIVWPLSIPGVFAAFLLTFVPAVGDYVNATILGGPGTTMIGVIIQTQFITNFAYPQGAALSFILMLVLLVGATLYSRALGHRRGHGCGGTMSATAATSLRSRRRVERRSGEARVVDGRATSCRSTRGSSSSRSPCRSS